MGRISDSEFGGTHFMGTGTYTANTPEQAAQLYGDVKAAAGSGKPGPEPPMGRGGTSYYLPGEDPRIGKENLQKRYGKAA